MATSFAACRSWGAKLIVNGGAIALGHRLGASGTKLLATLCFILARTSSAFSVKRPLGIGHPIVQDTA